MATVTKVSEGKRGCGYRKPGGLYLRCDSPGEPCGKLPLELHTCPVCNEGIKFSRNYKWINPSILFRDKGCRYIGDNFWGCKPLCVLNDRIIETFTKGLLIWIGEKHYPTVESYAKESIEMGISRRIKSVPRNFVVGESWVLLAHTKCFTNTIAGEEINKAGIFMIFKPTRVEYVITGKESEDELNGLELRGYTLVDVQKKLDGNIFEEDDEDE